MRNIINKGVWAVLALAVSIGISFMAEAASGDEALRSFVQSTADKVTQLAADNRMSASSKEAALTKVFVDVVDINFMAHSALGPAWRQLSQQDAGRYEVAYKNYLLSLYVPKFRYYNEHHYTVKSIQPRGGNQYTVSMEIAASGKKPINIAYLINTSSDHFKIRDIVAEGISLLATQRSDFSSVLNNQGIEQLIVSMQSMAQENEAS